MMIIINCLDPVYYSVFFAQANYFTNNLELLNTLKYETINEYSTLIIIKVV
jgi:hypothetical protein